jgi:uncharacterized membrane protein
MGVIMKKNKLVGALLLALAIATVVGIVIMNDAYWQIYNYVTLLITTLGGIVLLKQK